jgi:hypothetical protein
MTPNSDSGIVTIQSRHSVDQTVQKLEGSFKRKASSTLTTVRIHAGEPLVLVRTVSPRYFPRPIAAAVEVAMSLPWLPARTQLFLSGNDPFLARNQPALGGVSVGRIRAE